MIRRFLACACVLLSAAHDASPVFAAISVSASVESGTYDRVFEVKLVPSDPTAKLFYTFEPDGSPMDAYAYTGAIRVAASTPLLYFAFTDPTNESPIYRQDYELRYSTGVLLSVSPDDRIFSLSRPAAESGSIALDSWTLRKDGRTLHEFAATDFLSAWAAFSASFDLPGDFSAYGAYDLVAPDESIAASLSVSEPKPEVAIPADVSRPQSSLPRSVDRAPVDESVPVSPEMPSTSVPENSIAWSSATPDTLAEIPLPASDAPMASEGSVTLWAELTPDEIPAASAGQSQSEPEEKSSEAPENTTPDVSASARTFGGLLPLAVLLALGLGALAWRSLRRQTPDARLR